uniref:Uncharacterized protein n=1 Tax=Magnetospirillum gryphiswaldense TaxID=55518 RepID=A4TYZ8_9PROT|nr:hypothetical protein MGR_1512 [Magnetospirillum gryphiswaldense MSR-1]
MPLGPTPENEKLWAHRYLAEARYWREHGNRAEAASCLSMARGCLAVATALMRRS